MSHSVPLARGVSPRFHSLRTFDRAFPWLRPRTVVERGSELSLSLSFHAIRKLVAPADAAPAVLQRQRRGSKGWGDCTADGTRLRRNRKALGNANLECSTCSWKSSAL